MNKKYSTLLAMGLLLAGSLSGVSAEEFQNKFIGDAATKVEGGKYILVQNNAAIGFSNYSWQENTVELSKIALDTDESEIENYKDFVWVVTESTQLEKTVYKLTNAAYGLTLYVDKATGETIITDYDLVNSDYSAEWAWNSEFTSYEKQGTNGAYLIPGLASLNGRTNKALNWGTSYTFSTPDATNKISLFKLKDVAADSENLNMLYNTNGFNFALTTSGVDNIFANQKVKAIKLENDFVNDWDNDGYPMKGFPKGTYFVVNAPVNVNFADLPIDKQYDYLLNSTFIAVSPTECAVSNADKRKEGQGFKLVTVSGKDLNQFISERRGTLHDYADKLTSGAEVSVYNAAFNVYEDFEGGKYALSLDNVRFESVAGAGTHAQAALRIDILTDLNVVAGKTLATQSAGASKYIFKFVQPVTVTPKELLNNEGASIFNIQFGNTVAKGAYLTENYDHWTERYEVNGQIVTNNYEGIRYYTKGDVLADLNDPAFQYVITNVDGVNYTFTNRETQNDFVAQLYKEEDGCYSLFIDDYSWATILDYNTQNGVYPNETKSWTYLNGAHVKLIPAASTDKFNSYWTADSETLVTLAFARDNTPTSNKMYPAVEYGQNGYFTGNLEDEMTDDVTKAAQWQLVKAFNAPKYQTTTYAYLDKNDKVVYKTEGDTIAAYGYKLELIADGNPTNYFLSLGVDNSYNVAWNEGTWFHIKDNVDGSVSLFTWLDNYNTYLAVESHDARPQADFDDELNRKMIQAYKSMTYPSYDIKTYLIQDAPEISLPIETTFVTMQSEMGNYISMNEAQDGILVNLEPSTFKVFATDSAKAVPSFYVTFGKNEDGSRAYMFNPVDSVNYYVGAGAYDKKYEWSEGVRKVIFKDAILNETADTLTTSIKGKVANVAMAADRKGTQAGLDKFKFQIVKADPAEDAYIIRQNGNYLRALNGKLTFGNRTQAVLLNIENTTAPTANAAIEAAGVQVIGGEGVVTVQGAAGKVITVANILGQTIANQVAASDNVTIAVPAGIVVVAVDGEATKVVVK